jgi:hypothetical protein
VRAARARVDSARSRASDSLLDRVLSPTIFSTPTNRRIFRGMVVVADSESWQRIFQIMKENSRWDLPDAEVGLYLVRSFNFIIDLLRRMDSSEPYLWIRPATMRSAWRSGCAGQCCGQAASSDWSKRRITHFGMPKSVLTFDENLDEPLYVPASVRAASS